MSPADERTAASSATARGGAGTDSPDDVPGRVPGDPAASGSEPVAGAAAMSPSGTADSGFVFDDPLDRPSPDESDRGWGGSSSDGPDDDFTRFLNEKPPHHL